MLRRVILAGLSTCVLGLTFGFGQTAYAEEPCSCWIDVKTGKSVPTIPGGALYTDGGTLRSAFSAGSNDVHNPKTGLNFTRRQDGAWIDVKDGSCVFTIPGGALYTDGETLQSAFTAGSNDVHNPKTGENYVRVPCPPPPKT